MSLADCKLIELPKISDPRGNLTFVESSSHIPFNINRIYYLYDVPSSAERAGHAHKKLQQILIPISGSFRILLDSGREKKEFYLSQPNIGLYLTSMIWRELTHFSSNAICLALASEKYDESDYYRNYDDFLAAALNDEHSLC